MDYFIERKFAFNDYTFCENEKCKRRKDCARNLDKYDSDFRKGLISMSKFECEENK